MKKSLVFIHLNPAWEFYVFFCGLQGIRRVSKENAAHIQELIEPWFVFALIWSVGATGDSRGRVAFSSWLREKMAKEKVSKSKADPFSIIEEVVMRSRSQRVFECLEGLAWTCSLLVYKTFQFQRSPELGAPGRSSIPLLKSFCKANPHASSARPTCKLS